MTEQDLLEAIRQAHTIPGNDQAMTAGEIQAATGMGINQVRAKLKALLSEGKIEVTWVYRDTITTPLTGRQAKVPGYLVTPSTDMGHDATEVAGIQSGAA